jgi:hypothetical protein
MTIPEQDPADVTGVRGVAICMPVFNDWTSASLLVQRIDGVVERLGLPVSVPARNFD